MDLQDILTTRPSINATLCGIPHIVLAFIVLSQGWMLFAILCFIGLTTSFVYHYIENTQASISARLFEITFIPSILVSIVALSIF
jgi:type II secretory pathway component PulF